MDSQLQTIIEIRENDCTLESIIGNDDEEKVIFFTFPIAADIKFLHKLIISSLSKCC